MARPAIVARREPSQVAHLVRHEGVLPIFDRNQGNIAIEDATREPLRQERASAGSS
jgi:hypothetical protein